MNHLPLIAAVVLICVVLSFLFSGMESGVLALSRLRIRQLMRTGNANATVLLGYLEQPENFLWTILVGNTVANFVAVGLLVKLLHHWLMAAPALLLSGFLVMIFFFYAFCELLPKMLFRRFPNRLTLAMARPFRLIHFLLAPMVFGVTRFSQWLLKWTGGKAFTGRMFGSREEMRLVMQESSHGLTSEERLMINRVLDLQNLRLRDLATPIEKAATITTKTTVEEAMRISREHNSSRLAVWRVEGGKRQIEGVVNLGTMIYQPDLNPARPAADYIKPALYLEDEMRLEVALKRMQRSGQRLAIVLGANRRETGIVSLADIIKFILGDVKL